MDELSNDNKIELSQITQTIKKRIDVWKKNTSKIFYAKMNKIIFNITDLQSTIEVDFKNCSVIVKDKNNNPDIYIASQPLFYAFSMTFGIQTLGVSGRYKFDDKIIDIPLTWKMVRIISSLENVGIHLSLKSFFKMSTLLWLWERKQGLFSQVIQQFKRFFKL